jgi:hypothetical protein
MLTQLRGVAMLLPPAAALLAADALEVRPSHISVLAAHWCKRHVILGERKSGVQNPHGITTGHQRMREGKGYRRISRPSI